jgi:integrase/recombinase XerD
MMGMQGWRVRFGEHLKSQGFGELSIPDYLRNVGMFLEYLRSAGIEKLTEVDRKLMSDYQLELSFQTHKGKGLSHSTQRKRLTCVRQFFQYLLKEDAVLQDPTAELAFPPLNDQLPRDILTKREIGELLSEADPESVLGLRDRAMLEVLYSTGIRVSELAGLKLEDLDLRNAELRVFGKGKKERIVPLGEVVREYLERYLKRSRAILAGPEERSLFVSNRGRRFYYSNISFIVRNYGKRAGIKKHVSPHGLRHTCATHLLQGRADIRQIQRILGHVSIATTQRYTRVEITDLKKVLRRCHPRELRQIVTADVGA